MSKKKFSRKKFSKKKFSRKKFSKKKFSRKKSKRKAVKISISSGDARRRSRTSVAKKCPECSEYNAPSAAKCIECGFVFPE
jgi:hypothetical protein